MSQDTDQIYDFILAITKECGKLIKDRIWLPKAVEVKSCDIDLVTETDKEIETKLMTTISGRYPHHEFIGEETTATGVRPRLTAAPTWIIDPVDGTMNFVHGYPIVVISIALLIEKMPEIGIIYNPVLELLFTARRGRGAFLNGKKIAASRVTELSKALIQLECGPRRDPEVANVIATNVGTLKETVHGIRSTGSSAWNMAMVGLGGSDAYAEFGLHVWDMAAGDLIIREAGGVVMDPSGGPLDLMSRRVLCSGTESLAKQLIAVLKQYYPSRDD